MILHLSLNRLIPTQNKLMYEISSVSAEGWKAKMDQKQMLDTSLGFLRYLQHRSTEK
jgi:hypothetical protein